MMNLNSVSILALALFVGASADLHVKSKAQPQPIEINKTSNANAGVLIDDFSSEVYSWWKNSEEKFKYVREDEKLKVTVLSAGKANGYDCFGRQFDGMDLTKNPVIKLKIKADAALKFRIDLKDANGMVTNAKAINKQVPAGGEFVDYYFDFSNKWEQAWPDKQTVDPVEIVEMLIFINGGGPEFKGTIYLDDIYAVPVSELPAK
jgi:hypothetical protein